MRRAAGGGPRRPLTWQPGCQGGPAGGHGEAGGRAGSPRRVRTLPAREPAARTLAPVSQRVTPIYGTFIVRCHVSAGRRGLRSPLKNVSSVRSAAECAERGAANVGSALRKERSSRKAAGVGPCPLPRSPGPSCVDNRLCSEVAFTAESGACRRVQYSKKPERLTLLGEGSRNRHQCPRNRSGTAALFSPKRFSLPR